MMTSSFSSTAFIFVCAFLVTDAHWETHIPAYGNFCFDEDFLGHSKSTELRFRWSLSNFVVGHTIDITLMDEAENKLYSAMELSHGDWSGRLYEDGPHTVCFMNNGEQVDVKWNFDVDSKGFRVATYVATEALAISSETKSNEIEVIKSKDDLPAVEAFFRFDLTVLDEVLVQKMLDTNMRSHIRFQCTDTEKHNSPMFVYWYPKETGLEDRPNYFEYAWTADDFSYGSRPTKTNLVTRQRARKDQRVEVRFTRQLKELLLKPQNERQLTIGIQASSDNKISIAGLTSRDSEKPTLIVETDQNRLEVEFDKFARNSFLMHSQTAYSREEEMEIRDVVESTNTMVLWLKIAGFVGIALVSIAQIWYTRSLFESRYT